MTWQPLKALPDPVENAMHDAVRAAILPLDVYTGVSRGAADSFAVDLADGRRLNVSLRVLAQTATTFGPRQAVRYDLEGQAVLGTEALGLAAQATLDIKTRAFFDLACEILWRTRRDTEL